MSILKRLATKLDTWHGPRQLTQFREGWASNTSPDVAFYKSPLAQYRYRVQGSGPTIVFAADPPMTLENYDALIDIFAKTFRVVIFELPAMGFSAVETSYGFDFIETNDDVAIFLRAIAGEKAILAFSCVAGLCAIDVAVRFPELVSSLTLFQTGDVKAFKVWKAARDPKGILGRPFVGQLAMRRLAPKRMPDWYKISVGRTEMVPQLCRCAANSFQHGSHVVARECLPNLYGPQHNITPTKSAALGHLGYGGSVPSAAKCAKPQALGKNCDLYCL